MWTHIPGPLFMMGGFLCLLLNRMYPTLAIYPGSHHLWCIPFNLVGVQFFYLALVRGDL